jgi:hypothetical protein
MPACYLGEKRKNGDSSMATHNRDIHLCIIPMQKYVETIE